MNRDDPTVARIARSILFPRLLMGMPKGYVMGVGLLTLLSTIMWRQYILGPAFGAIMVFIGQYFTRRDPFMFAIIDRLIRHFGFNRKVVLK